LDKAVDKMRCKVGVTGPDRVLKVNSVVDLLQICSPSSLERLRREHPQYGEILQPGFKLGDEALPSKDFLIALAKEGVAAAELQVSRLLSSIQTRLLRAKWLKLVSAVVSAVSSVGVVSAAIAEAKMVTIITSLLTLTSSLSGLVAQHLESPIIGKGGGIAGYLEETLGAESSVAELKTKLFLMPSASSEQIISTLNEANRLCSLLRCIKILCGA
jgi:hypothetical protein